MGGLLEGPKGYVGPPLSNYWGGAGPPGPPSSYAYDFGIITSSKLWLCNGHILTPNMQIENRCANTLMCLSIGTPKNNKFSICSKWTIHYFQVPQNLGRVQPHYNILEYWDN